MRSKFGVRSFAAAAVLVVAALSFSGRLPLSFVDQDEPGPITASRVFSNNVKAYAHKNPLQEVFAPANALIEDDDPFVDQDGLLYFHPASTVKSIWRRAFGGRPPPKQRHPILYLIERAEKEWKDKLAQQSQTLQEAVLEYKRRYNRPPPAGFDRWWQFCQENGVGLPDEYDTIMDQLGPFSALHPDIFQQRHAELPGMAVAKNSFVYEIKDGKDVWHIELPKYGRLASWARFLEPIVQHLPDMNFTINLSDSASQMISGEAKVRLVEAAKSNTFLTPEQSDELLDPRGHGFFGWSAGCPPNSNIRRSMHGHSIERPASRSFITDVIDSADVCKNPDIQTVHGVFNNGAPRIRVLHPHFSFSKTTTWADLIVTPLEQFYQDVGTDYPWAEKTINKAVWRGSNTGCRWNRDSKWRLSQRGRLALLDLEKDRDLEVHYADADGSIVGANEAVEDFTARTLDIHFAGEAWGCNKEDGTCDAMNGMFNFTKKMLSAEQNQFKYIIDTDGNGWSGRFHRLMLTNSAVMKSTFLPEWYQKRIVPWYHFIPLKMDYTDIYDIMAFFVGDANGQRGHDALGEKIGRQGKEWTQTYWREVDMQAYMLRLLLEYSRLLYRTADEPHKADYVS